MFMFPLETDMVAGGSLPFPGVASESMPKSYRINNRLEGEQGGRGGGTERGKRVGVICNHLI